MAVHSAMMGVDAAVVTMAGRVITPCRFALATLPSALVLPIAICPSAVPVICSIPFHTYIMLFSFNVLSLSYETPLPLSDAL